MFPVDYRRGHTNMPIFTYHFFPLSDDQKERFARKDRIPTNFLIIRANITVDHITHYTRAQQADGSYKISYEGLQVRYGRNFTLFTYAPETQLEFYNLQGELLFTDRFIS